VRKLDAGPVADDSNFAVEFDRLQFPLHEFENLVDRSEDRHNMLMPEHG